MNYGFYYMGCIIWVIGQIVCPVVGQPGEPWYSVGVWNSSQSMPVPYRIGMPVVCHAPSGLCSQASQHTALIRRHQGRALVPERHAADAWPVVMKGLVYKKTMWR